MKKLLYLFSAITVFACNEHKEAKVESITATRDTAAHIKLPYDIEYSSTFEMGDPKHVQTLLTIWKSWDDGDVMNIKDHIADSFEMRGADGSVISGSRDSVMKIFVEFRKMFKSIDTKMHAVVPVHSVDKNDNWVYAWASEVQHMQDGKVDSVQLHESWRFNKEGKADLMIQYQRSPVIKK